MLASSVFLAALLDNKVPVMLNPASSIERLNAIFQITEPALIVVGESDKQAQLQSLSNFNFADMPATVPGQQRLIDRLLGTTQKNPNEPGLQREPLLEADNDALAYLLFTSGTTGEPSGVEITHGALQAHMATLTRLFDYSEKSCIANPTPLSHTDGLAQGLLLSVANGACLLRPGQFSLDNLEEWLDQFSGHGVSHLITNPTVITLIHQLARQDDYFDFEGFRAVISSASVLRDKLWSEFEKRFNCRLFNLYGMTETVANATYAGRHPEMGKPGTIGVPVDCQARVVDPANGTISIDSAGELQLKGAHICRGYWRNPDRNRASFVEDGWFRTGDLVKQDSAGNLIFVGRLKSIINSGGLSIAPEEIDEALLRHDSVLESVTVGLPNFDFEEIAVSAVVLKQVLPQEQLLAHARQMLEPLKVPKHILQVDQIQRGGAGKPDLTLIKAELKDIIASHGSGQETTPDHQVSMQAVIDLAARVFSLDSASLNGETSPATLPAWDSFNHLTLILEAERTFDLTIPTAAIASIGSLKDLHETISS